MVLQKICESFWDDQGVETVLEKNVESYFFVSFGQVGKGQYPFYGFRQAKPHLAPRVSPPHPLPHPLHYRGCLGHLVPRTLVSQGRPYFPPVGGDGG